MSWDSGAKGGMFASGMGTEKGWWYCSLEHASSFALFGCYSNFKPPH